MPIIAFLLAILSIFAQTDFSKVNLDFQKQSIENIINEDLILDCIDEDQKVMQSLPGYYFSGIRFNPINVDNLLIKNLKQNYPDNNIKLFTYYYDTITPDKSCILSCNGVQIKINYSIDSKIYEKLYKYEIILGELR